MLSSCRGCAGSGRWDSHNHGNNGDDSYRPQLSALRGQTRLVVSTGRDGDWMMGTMTTRTNKQGHKT